ncbi:TetR/AcrR family transcriptional regulator [bacterium (Candidatus Blackallbacteria) CG17_big_fil_post_rev_8_21_14_2_50_48_46]|uniref:TetR/AcrR family transcriptional regulator n=1 Tax=bacterium (Candidatus Blackallbacteria) CG17_big_fil_post_rev_8_21_14_2_50_48_46 TaxID=2014261 RepID=A0A2M7G4B7_9BACT|nr:MAG: TetR family transcriptional regulator [bacterium (Candidatus Blackallbacteria) CG18_big_fil_WC_8_21_14_2_50_49_26]PIW16657.1 MAG: TetR/AcrR family transcriptional regulator [bacterium (Candidatus Blackallbacteria) CG17_big_fil_post_rev_8_21_14_2_50_48_46]PIW46163.1 MAG: TetR/AcrR family transcriptional regulator [bacterium (Candidatus Blackallbacteria) CG13_big_fil_rev_8_21_14_2_50_49_14]
MGRPKQISNEQIIATARRCFLERGAGVSAIEIASELGVSHTTLFNRFGSKEALMLAALGSSEKLSWVKALEAGPDLRPIREQLLEHSKVIANYFQALQESMAVLQAAGLKPGNSCDKSNQDSPPAQAFRAFTAWLQRAQDQGRLAPCNVETLASTILGALHNWAFTQNVCHVSSPAVDGAQVEDFIELLWHGIEPQASTEA